MGYSDHDNIGPTPSSAQQDRAVPVQDMAVLNNNNKLERVTAILGSSGQDLTVFNRTWQYYLKENCALLGCTRKYIGRI